MNILIKNPGFSRIITKILSILDTKNQLICRLGNEPLY